jgi:cysteine desulfurase family protein (TIGR01976 family)
MSQPAQAPTAARVVPTTEIRAEFPALERREGGEAVAYFDGPGGTQVPRAVGDAMTDYLFNHNANTHWSFPTSEETDAAIAGAREAMADLLNASPGEIAFGQNMTSLTFHLARALGRGFGPGDEVVVTELDHQANVAPWEALVRERGVTLRTVPMEPETTRLDLDHLTAVLSPRTRVLAIGAASNAFGTVSDVRAAARQAHAVGALVFVDAVHYAPHFLIDVADLGCDFLACSAYKFYGPHLGVLYGRRDLLESLDVPKLAPAPDTAPERLETGTLNHEGIAGASAAVGFLASLAEGPTRRGRLRAAFDTLHQRSSVLVTQLRAGLGRISGVRLYGPPPSAPQTPTVSFTLAGRPSAEVARGLAARGVFVSHGDFYASTAVRRLALDPSLGGLVRAGCACHTTDEEVARLVDGVRAVVG